MKYNLYSMLGVPADADAVAIALAYARRLHNRRPDHLHAALTYAFLVLSDPRRRAAYDAALRELAPAEEAQPAR